MELMLKEYPIELEIGTSMASIQNAMDLQKQLFHSQIDELKNVVVTQCKLTGVNPLSQEMAAGALSIKIGKRPRDLLNPKAVKYMQAVFSVKDAISKKESREIGALFGLTVTQVREYFASQRTRVRKMVRLSREKAIRASASKELQHGASADADPMLPIEPVPLCTVGPSVAEEAASCSSQDEFVEGLGESDRQFVESIFNSMRKEESFSGQVKLMERIMEIENTSVLLWFLTKGGVMILATWLSQAAGEEQTSVLSIALKVLCHLPLHKALPDYMSAILQSVNRLRFYRVPDISNRARVLLSKWSKMFAKSQALKKTNGIRASGTQQDIDLSQRIDELMGDWQSSIVNHDGSLVPSYGDPDDNRKLATPEDVKLLTAPSDDTNKKLMLGPCSHNKERRKVLLVEQPGQKTASKNQQVKAVPANQVRPITADEIQKAKIRAQFMQSNKMKTEGLKRPSLLTNDFLSASEAYLRPKLEAQKKARMLPVPPRSMKQEEPESIKQELPKHINQKEPNHIKQEELKNIKQEEPPNEKPNLERKESLLDKCRRVQIPWQAPPEVEHDPDWGVGTGENSKEMEVQKNRMRREKETIYGSIQEVPFNPKEPWDTEMDFDDTLTPEIPIEQLPDADAADAALNTREPENQNPSGAFGNPTSTSSQPAAEPDLELLAVLLKNPELVFALTSGQSSGISNEDTVKLLDMLKASGGGAALLNGLASQSEAKRVEASLPSPTPTPMRNVEVSLPSPTPPSRVEASLPSPTPSSNLGPSGWTLQIANNPFSRHTVPAGATTVTVPDRQQSSSIVQSQFTSGTLAPSLLHPSSQPPIPAFRSSSLIADNQSVMYNPALNQATPTNYHHMSLSVNNLQSTVPTMPERLSGDGHQYPRSQEHSQLSHHPEYQVPEDANMGVINARRHGLAHNTFSSTHGNQNVYNPITRGAGPSMRPGPIWERDEFNLSRQKGGYESWSPEISPGPPSYVPPEHGHGWSYPEQRGYRRGPPSDRLGRDQHSPGFREQHWQGGGNVNRRWREGDRRR